MVYLSSTSPGKDMFRPLFASTIPSLTGTNTKYRPISERALATAMAIPDLGQQGCYHPMIAYCISKIVTMLFTSTWSMAYGRKVSPSSTAGPRHETTSGVLIQSASRIDLLPDGQELQRHRTKDSENPHVLQNTKSGDLPHILSLHLIQS